MLADMAKPTLYIVTGLPYAGKSVLSRELVRRFGYGYASVDDEITSGGYDVTVMSQPDWDDVYTRAFAKLEGLLRSGRTTVFDGGSLRRSNRQSLRDTACACGAEALLIYVNTAPEVAAQRRVENLATRERAHLEAETIATALAMFEEPAPDEQPCIYNAAVDLDEWIDANILPMAST
jgi:predicted kinase